MTVKSPLNRREDMRFDGNDFSRDELALDSKGEPLLSAVSQTRQEFMDECDVSNIINNIMRGVPQKEGVRNLEFNDNALAPNYHEALNILAAADQQFAQLPATTRDFFHNNPGKFVAFMDDEKNYDKAHELGLLDPVKVAARADQIASAATAAAAKASAKDSKPAVD